jgi:SAM-dependent methyltransferase
MKLSQLVRYLNCIDAQPLPDPDAVCDRELGELARVVSEGQPSLTTRIGQLAQDREQAVAAIQSFRDHIADTRQDIVALIEGMQPAYFADSYRLHDQEMANDSDQHILDRRPALEPSVQRYLTSRIGLHSDWHHAAMVIRPGAGEWLPLMVGSDPLYLLDIRSSLLDPATEQFPPEYQRRLRRYVLRETDAEGRVLRDLPDGQFGFCLVMNFFHFKPFELIRLYLADIYRKLKPGGVVALTFNDCDRWGAVELAERHFMCYTPGTMLISLAHSLGFEIQQRYDIDNSNTWLEMRRPGELTSVRGGQSLAKIVANT